MREYIWTEKGFDKHSGISIIDSVANRGIISIRVPNSHAGLLNYIDAELQVLQNRSIPFLLVNCGVDISQHPAMQKRFLNEHEGNTYYTAIIAASLASIIDQNTQREKFFSQYQQLFVFNCPVQDVAEPFSAQFGEYYRLETEHTTGHTRAPFDVLASHQNSRVAKYVLERNIKPEDLIGLGQGILLCGKAYSLPCLIQHYQS